MKSADVATKWDADGTGAIAKKDFVRHALALGVDASESAEVEALVDELDLDVHVHVHVHPSCVHCMYAGGGALR